MSGATEVALPKKLAKKEKVGLVDADGNCLDASLMLRVFDNADRAAEEVAVMLAYWGETV